MNAEWHRAHVLGQHASLEQRIAWHEEHARECACRAMPASIAQAIATREASPAPRPAAGQVVPGNTAP
jgi:hypothetical protein